MGDAQIKEAGWVAQSVTGASAYLYSVGYNQDKFKQELDKAVAYIQQKASQG